MSQRVGQSVTSPHSVLANTSRSCDAVSDETLLPPCVGPGHHAQMNQQHMIPTRNFQMHRMPADDIQDDFDWDSIV